jgi:DNA-directed RNA polymerase specialized sigma24 family protein
VHKLSDTLLKVKSGQWPQITNPRPWIRTVALNHYRDRRHTQTKSAALTDPTPDIPEPGPGHAELTGQALDVVAALKLIDDEDARAVVALDMDDIPGPAIAATLGRTEQQIRDLRKKARRTLKKHLHAPSHRSATTLSWPAGIERRDGR